MSLSLKMICAALALVVLLPNASAQSGLKDAYKNSLLIGAALNRAQIYGTDARDVAIVQQNFNSISPSYVLKWPAIHPEIDRYDFEAADRYVEFGQANHMFIVGHTLIWHSQTPAWVFLDRKGKRIGRRQLLRRMGDYIHTVVGRYKGRINGWDVVNEALDSDGNLRQSSWLKIIGEDYIAKAFKYAHEADPGAELYYNDYELEDEGKRRGAIELIKKLKAKGVHITAVGLQNHDSLDWPSLEDEDAAISTFAGLGIKVNITELDVDVLPRATKSQGADVAATAGPRPELNPYVDGLPDSVQRALAKRYADLFGLFLKHRGVADGDSWLNNWPVRGRTSYPLLFDREGKPKPAYQAVMGVGRSQAAEP